MTQKPIYEEFIKHVDVLYKNGITLRSISESVNMTYGKLRNLRQGKGNVSIHELNELKSVFKNILLEPEGSNDTTTEPEPTIESALKLIVGLYAKLEKETTKHEEMEKEVSEIKERARILIGLIRKQQEELEKSGIKGELTNKTLDDLEKLIC